jgi:hypothetical protein
VQAAGELEMAVPNGSRGLEHPEQLFILQHKTPATPRSRLPSAYACKREP